MIEERQKKLDAAQKALHFLRTACIVWPNPASEVFLAGSFDGWASQVRIWDLNFTQRRYLLISFRIWSAVAICI